MEYKFIKKYPKATFNEITEDEDLQTITNAIMKTKGKTKGDILLSNISYIRRYQGEKGLAKIEQKLKELGYPFEFSNIKPMEWYPEAYSVMLNILHKELFNLSDDDIFEAGRMSPGFSLFFRILMKYIISPKTLMNKASDYWSKMFDFGRIEAKEINENQKYVIFRVHGYNKSSISCVYQAGYYLALLSYVIRTKKITIEETACIYRGDGYHEYTIRWE